MKLPNSSKQLTIIRETIEIISRESDEDKRVEAIFHAFEKLGLKGDFRYRIFLLLKDENLLVMRYLRGDYGGVDLKGARYSPSGSEVAGTIVKKETPVTPSGQASKYTPMSLLAIPLIKHNEVFGVLSFDSTEKNAFSKEIVAALQPYAYLLSSTFEQSVVVKEYQTDVVSYISRSRRKQILVLGKDTGEELQRLVSICTELRKFGYVPLLVKDYPDFPEMSNEEKVRVFADASRFVVLENSFPAGQIAECKMCATNRIITAALREKGRGSSYMVTDYFKDFDFMKEFAYESDSLREALKNAVDWAERKTQERVEYYDNLYPWRKKDSDSKRNSDIASPQ